MNLSLKLKSTSAIFVRTKAASYKAQIRQDYYNAIEGKKDSILQSVFRKIQKRFQNMLTIKNVVLIYRKILYIKQENYDILIHIRKMAEQCLKEAQGLESIIFQSDLNE